MSDLTSLLKQELALVERFVETLGAEQAALKAGKPDALPAIGASKTQQVDELNAITGERNKLLLQAGCQPDREGMRTWLGRNRNDREALGAWSRLIKKAAEAQELNRVNGVLIAMHLQNTNDALIALHRQNQQTTLYDRGGLATGFTGSRIIDSA